jgi:O-antigen/teichoic acid export membrane protein
MTDDVRRRVVRAVGAASIGNGLAKVVSLASTLVLARLLTPEDFGLMAMASTVTGFIGFFNEMGIGAAIVQRTNIRKEEINGCFGIAILASSLLSLLVVAISWPSAAFFNMPKLQLLLSVLGMGFMFGAINTVPAALLRKELRLQAVMWLALSSSIIQALVAIPLAALGFGYWSIVGGFFVGQTITTLWYWRISSWRPSWPLHMREGRQLLGYGMNITFSRILWHAYMNADKLIVGKMLNASAVGIYDVSRSLANLPTAQISGLVTGIASPVFARLQDDLPKLRSAQLRLTRGVAYLTFPLLAGIAVLAPELVLVLLGSKWTDAIFPMQALCISEAVASISNLQSQVLISTGRARQLVYYNILCAIIIPISLAISAGLYGLNGIAITWAVIYPLLTLWLWRNALNASGSSAAAYWHALRQPILGSLIMVLAILGVRSLLETLIPPPLVVLLIGIATGVFIYLGYLVLIDKAGMAEVSVVLKDFGVPPRILSRWPFNQALAPQGNK